MTVWFDSFTQNIDRTPRNANLLVWHRKLYPIDHGAALFFHHDWASREKKIDSPFAEIRNHILLPWATRIPEAAKTAHTRLTPEELGRIVGLIPDAWLEAIPGGIAPAERRAGYMDFFTRRLQGSAAFEEEAIRAHSGLV
jgi:hypothetical protein